MLILGFGTLITAFLLVLSQPWYQIGSLVTKVKRSIVEGAHKVGVAGNFRWL